MKNPLVETCLEIARSGYSKSEQINAPYNNATLLQLGRFLLARSGCSHGGRLHYSKREDSLALAFGAGIDSYCALIAALEGGYSPIYLVHVNYGQPYYRAEAQVVSKITCALLFERAPSIFRADLARFPDWRDRIKIRTEAHELVPSYVTGLDWENYIIPARNLVLAAIASSYSHHIWVVANHRRDETVGTPDKTSYFFQRTAQVLTDFYGQHVIFGSPFFTQSKLEVVQNYLKRGGNIHVLKATTSCYSPEVEDPPFQCGWCYACYKRYQLFQALNEEFIFNKHPKDGPNWDQFNAKEAAKRD